MSYLAVARLFAETKTAFETDGSGVPVVFGWKSTVRQPNYSHGRIAWVPGDAAGKVGELGAAIKPGQRAGGRAIASLGELVSVYVYGADVAAIDDELAQYVAARELFDYWFATVRKCSYLIESGGRVSVDSLDWFGIEKNERPHGRVLRALLNVDVALNEKPPVVAKIITDGEFETGLSRDGDTITASDGQVKIPETT